MGGGDCPIRPPSEDAPGLGFVKPYRRQLDFEWVQCKLFSIVPYVRVAVYYMWCTFLKNRSK